MKSEAFTVRVMTLILCSTFMAPLQRPYAAQAQPAESEYVVGPEDVLNVMVWGLPELSGKFGVDAAGTLQLPLIERVAVSGLTVRAIEEEIKKRLLDGYLKNPQVSVTVETYRSQRVFVQGEFRQPGTYTLSGATTLLELVARAGSLTPDAGDEIIITRQPRPTADLPASKANSTRPPAAAPEVVRVSVRELMSGSTTENITLRDGDTVHVAAGEKVYITGHVRNPNAYSVRKDTTILQALALAGGPTDRAATNRIKVRRLVGGKPKESDADLDDVVQPGDTIIVPERFF